MAEDLPNDPGVLREELRKANLWCEWADVLATALERLVDTLERPDATRRWLELTRGDLEAAMRGEPVEEWCMAILGPAPRIGGRWGPKRFRRHAEVIRGRVATASAYRDRVVAKLESLAAPVAGRDRRVVDLARDPFLTWPEIADRVNAEAAERGWKPFEGEERQARGNAASRAARRSGLPYPERARWGRPPRRKSDGK